LLSTFKGFNSDTSAQWSPDVSLRTVHTILKLDLCQCSLTDLAFSCGRNAEHIQSQVPKQRTGAAPTEERCHRSARPLQRRVRRHRACITAGPHL